jgi:hypothetical protein
MMQRRDRLDACALADQKLLSSAILGIAVCRGSALTASCG